MHGRSHRDEHIAGYSEPDERYYGAHRARVVDIKDPQKQGRIRVRYEWLEEEDGPPLVSDWITREVAWSGPTKLADRKRVFDCNVPMPEVGSLVNVHFYQGDMHDAYFSGQPQYQEGPHGSPPTDKDSETDRSWRIAFQNGLEIGGDTEGNMYLVIPGNLRIKVGGATHHSARKGITEQSLNIRLVGYSEVRTISAHEDHSNAPRPDEAAELREMAIDSFTFPQGRTDPLIGEVTDLPI
jgi:hypothetical protein